MLRAIGVLRKGQERALRSGKVKLLASYCEKKEGNIAILFAFMFALLMLFTGGAVDYTRYNAVRSDLVESLDAAGLAMAQIDALNGPDISGKSGAAREAYLREQGKKFFDENFKHASWVTDLSVDFDMDPMTITPRATGTIKTLFLNAAEALLHKMTGAPVGALASLDLTTDTEITRRGSGKIELALVLDVTGSMGDKAKSTDTNTKIESLSTAVSNLLQVMYGDDKTSSNLKIGIVPFNAYVNAGGASSWQDSWGDKNAESAYHGAHFIHMNATGAVDNSTLAKGYNAGGIAKVLDVTKKVNHYDLYKSHSSVKWAGCVEARPFPLDELDTPPGVATTSAIVNAATSVPTELASPATEFETRSKDAFSNAPAKQFTASELAASANSRFVPLFQADEADCGSSACGWSGSASVSYSMGGTNRNLTAEGYYFDDPDDKSGISESSYGNRTFISDYRYTKSNQGDRFARYLDAVVGSRMAIDNSFATLDNYWDGVKTKLADLGATTISSTTTSCNKKGKNCTTTNTYGHEFILRNSYVGWWDASLNRYTGKFDQSPSIDETYSGGKFKEADRGPNQDCPAAILPLTNDRTTIEDHMKLLVPHGNTDSANGAIWGVRLLSKDAPFTEGVAYDDPDWSKAIVLMTDGENTVGDDDTHWLSANTSYGYAIEQRMGVGVNKPTKGATGFQADRMADQIDEKLVRICHRAKQEGILVYTIIFGLDDADTEKVFKSCATEPKAPYYYKAPSAAELEAAFGDIAQDLVKLHVSK